MHTLKVKLGFKRTVSGELVKVILVTSYTHTHTYIHTYIQTMQVELGFKRAVSGELVKVILVRGHAKASTRGFGL